MHITYNNNMYIDQFINKLITSLNQNNLVNHVSVSTLNTLILYTYLLTSFAHTLINNNYQIK